MEITEIKERKKLVELPSNLFLVARSSLAEFYKKKENILFS
jgi:hypothetical protein